MSEDKKSIKIPTTTHYMNSNGKIYKTTKIKPRIKAKKQAARMGYWKSLKVWWIQELKEAWNIVKMMLMASGILFWLMIIGVLLNN